MYSCHHCHHFVTLSCETIYGLGVALTEIIFVTIKSKQYPQTVRFLCVWELFFRLFMLWTLYKITVPSPPLIRDSQFEMPASMGVALFWPARGQTNYAPFSTLPLNYAPLYLWYIVTIFIPFLPSLYYITLNRANRVE